MLVRDVGRIQNIIGRVLSDTGQAYFVDAVRRCQSQFLFEYGGVEVEEEQVQHFSRENSGDCLTYRRARSEEKNKMRASETMVKNELFLEASRGSLQPDSRQLTLRSKISKSTLPGV